MPQDLDPSYAAAVDLVLRRSYLMSPDELGQLAAEGMSLLGATSTTVWLVDYEQQLLVALLGPGVAPREPLSVDGSAAGRAFRLVEVVQTDGGVRLWLPLLDGVARLGVLELGIDAPVEPQRLHALQSLAHLLAELLISNGEYTDHYEWFRRQEAMVLAAEMQHTTLPPLTFGTDRVVISGLLAPAYEVGGDAFDYAVNGTIAHVAVFDAVGHGLQASLLSALAVAAYRNSRRAGLDLADTAVRIDEALAEMFGGERFVTALLGQLDLDTGLFRWVNAGHPAAMLLRAARVVKELAGEPALPLGMGSLSGASGRVAFPVTSEALQPGDRLLLLTDGVDEARTEDGEFFGRDRLADFAAREAATGLPTPEVMRRLQQAVLRHQVGQLQDDATTLLIEWLDDAGRNLS